MNAQDQNVKHYNVSNRNQRNEIRVNLGFKHQVSTFSTLYRIDLRYRLSGPRSLLQQRDHFCGLFLSSKRSLLQNLLQRRKGSLSRPFVHNNPKSNFQSFSHKHIKNMVYNPKYEIQSIFTYQFMENKRATLKISFKLIIKHQVGMQFFNHV